jgi:hypothetical protein
MRHPKRWRIVSTAMLVLLSGVVGIAGSVPSQAEEPTECRYRYVAGGEAVTFGMEAEEQQDQESETERYSRDLLEDHLSKAPGPWCEYNTSKDPATTKQYMEDKVYEGLSQQAAAWERDAHLITLTIGRQNSTIINHVDQCFTNVRDHDFIEANACALLVLAAEPAWNTLKQELTQILNAYRIQQVGSPNDKDLIIAVTGYFNPFPSATSVATQIPGFCAQLVDTIPTCIARWVLLPPALITLDQVVKKLNTTIEETVKPFTTASQGRFVFVNPYDKFKSHCMRMNVTIKTKVYHPTNQVDQHDTQKTNFGCNDSWIAKDGVTGRKSPFLYLTPAVNGVLIFAEQTTEDMGIYPNKDGHDCIGDLVWEAVKIKLGVPEESQESDACKGD